MKLTFKEYLDSKNRLLEAIQKSPVQRSVYDISRYCKLAVYGEDDSKITLLLKPKQQVVVEWKYEDVNDPTPVHIRFEDEKNPTLNETDYFTNWKGSKLKSWLSKNTNEVTP
jgi:hypothetical protein